MLTIRQNLLETIRGGSPDRFVNQYEYLDLVFDPITMNCAGGCQPGETKQTDWGFWVTFPGGTPGPFPVHTGDKILIKDVTRWREVLKAPDPMAYPQPMWDFFAGLTPPPDRNERFTACTIYTGIFEKLHYMMSMDTALVNLIVEPEAMHELIDFLTDWEIECAKVQIEHIHPDALFHHDDFGSQTKSFMSPEMFEEFFVPAYKRIYSFWKANGVQIIVHHSDSYAANLVPGMIEMGVDIFQGAVSENNIPELLRKYGGQISIHGGLDNGKFDTADWSAEKIRAALVDLIESCGTKYLIPGFTQGGPGSIYPGAYEAAAAAIEVLSKIYFK